MRTLVDNALTILVDRDASAIDSLGFLETDEETGRLAARPSVFIVDDRRVVRYRYIGKTAEDRPKVALLLLGVETMYLSHDS